MWVINESSAPIGGVDLGAPGPFTPQAHLGDFLIPQRGIFVIGSAYLELCGEGYRAERSALYLLRADEVLPEAFSR